MTHKEYIRAFLNKYTNHSASAVVIRKSPKDGYSIKLPTGERVHAWINESMLSYGIMGWGICSSVPLSTLTTD